MAQAPTFGSRLKALALALLNATLMLTIILVVVTLMLVARVQRLADTATGALDGVTQEARAAVAEHLPRVTATMDTINALNARIDTALAREGEADTATATELAGLRADVQALSAQVSGLSDGLSDGLHQMGTEGYQALIAALREVLAEASTRIGAQLPDNRGTE